MNWTSAFSYLSSCLHLGQPKIKRGPETQCSSWQETELSIQNMIEGSRGLEAFGDHPQATLYILADWDQNAALWALELGFSYHPKVCDSEKSLLREECGKTGGKG